MSTKIYESDFLELTEYSCPVKQRCIQVTKLRDKFYDGQYITLDKNLVIILISELQRWLNKQNIRRI